MNIRAYDDAVLSVAFSPDGKTLASGGGDYRVTLWDVATGTARQQLWMPSKLPNTTCVVYSRDGTMLAAADCDGQILIWNLKPDPTGKGKGKCACAKAVRGHEPIKLLWATSQTTQTSTLGSCPPIPIKRRSFVPEARRTRRSQWPRSTRAAVSRRGLLAGGCVLLGVAGQVVAERRRSRKRRDLWGILGVDDYSAEGDPDAMDDFCGGQGGTNCETNADRCFHDWGDDRVISHSAGGASAIAGQKKVSGTIIDANRAIS